MGLFTKKEDSRVPEVPSLPEFPETSKDKGLPTLPHNLNEDVNRSIIKSAVNDNENSYSTDDSKEGMIPSLPLEESHFPPTGDEMISSIVEGGSEQQEYVKAPESVFVRIDKFRAAKKEFGNIRKGLLEAESLISKINEVKMKEDNEVKEINLNLDKVKKKIDEIDSLVFNKV